MNDFWTNIYRYPTFVISSFIGLILVILTPFRNLFKIKKLKFLVIFFVIIAVTAICFIIANMTGM